MKFGLAYSFQVPAGSTVTHAQLWSEALKEASLAEDLGYDSLFLVEHHFLEDGMNPSLLSSAAALAAATERIRIGTSCYLLPLHHPIETAENAAVVDNISNGRLTLGIAAAYRDEEFKGFGIERDERGPRMEEYLQVLQQAWTMDAVTFKGRYYECEDLRVTPKPVQRPIPIWFGASGTPGLRRAAKHGLPLVGSNRHHISELEKFYSEYRGFLRQAGKSVSEVPLLRNVFVSESDEKAVAAAAGSMMLVLGGMYGKWARWRPMTDDRGRSPDDPAFFEFESHREKCIIGGPKTIVSQIEAYAGRLGVNHLICWMALPGMEHDKVEDSMRRLAKDVIPSFR